MPRPPFALLLVFSLLTTTAAPVPPSPCAIEVVEEGADWPVPLVELRTTHGVRLVSDNAGRIACDLPELFGRESWFTVIGHGYERPADGFGNRGVRLTPTPGGHLRVTVRRTHLARRLGRLTGAGLLAESQKLGLVPLAPENGVVGCDSVQTALYGGRCFWIWGDTSLARYPLGIFDGTGATTAPAPFALLPPPLPSIYEYFTDAAGAPRAVVKMPGEGPTWIGGLVSLPDQTGRERLVAAYAKIRRHLEEYDCGLCVWDDAAARFLPAGSAAGHSAPVPPPAAWPRGHAARWRDDAGRDWVLFGNPFPTLRCPARYEAFLDAATWEPLVPQSTVAVAGAGTQTIRPHSGAIAWNVWRRRWVTVFLQHEGRPSGHGEIWYAEAPAPTGPWGPAVKILTHENYTFYNPALHAGFTPPDSPVLLFEGTYTREFANHAEPTPRYDYNQVLYRLDLDDPALAPARAR